MSQSKAKLSSTAYQVKEGETFTPFTAGKSYEEMTIKAVISGMILGIVFGSANVYLGLKAGLTISTSIPVAVLTVTVFNLLGRAGIKHNILESNMSQTIGSASSSVASGVLFTLPALFIWGMKPELLQMTLLAMAGGLMGILAMIPLRRFLIKKEHGNLPYPEGMACAEVLVAGENGGKQASGVFWGIGVGILFKLLTAGAKLIPEALKMPLGFKASFAIKASPALMGVGYILGLRIATIMVAGSALAAFVITPIIFLWGRGFDAPYYPETVKLIADMSSHDIWNRYIRYIGAGAVATGGIITLIQSIPAMIESFRIGLEQLKQGRQASQTDRTDRDLSFKVVAIFLLAILIVLTFTPGVLGYIDEVWVRGLSSILIAVFAFFFVTVSSRIVGLVGVTSNPTSGMTIATLIGTSLIFYFLDIGGPEGKATALMVGTVVCIAASISGDTSQDLKTGFVLGATPRLQQIGELVGVITSAGFVCFVLILLDQTYTLGSAELPAPQAALMKLVIDGVIDQKLPWNLVFIGAGLAVAVWAMRLPPLPFAVGVYLPLSTMAAVFAGGLVRHLVCRNQKEEESERRREQGTLFASGLVGGEGLTGVLLAGYIVISQSGNLQSMGFGLDYGPVLAGLVTAAGIFALAACLWWQASRRLD